MFSEMVLPFSHFSKLSKTFIGLYIIFIIVCFRKVREKWIVKKTKGFYAFKI